MKRPSQKVAALSHLANYLKLEKRKLIFNSMIKSQFIYCPLVWMFYSRTSSNLINKTQECSLRLILNDHESSFVELLQENSDILIYQINIQILPTDIFKTITNIAPPIMEGIFNTIPNNYN